MGPPGRASVEGTPSADVAVVVAAGVRASGVGAPPASDVGDDGSLEEGATVGDDIPESEPPAAPAAIMAGAGDVPA